MKKNKVLCLLTIVLTASKLYGMESEWGTQSMMVEPYENIFWPTTPEKQIEYLRTKEWDIPTKTYILQLLWWNTRQKLSTVEKKSYEEQSIFQQMRKFGAELQKIGQPLPSIAHKKGQKQHPQFTFQLTRIPKDIAPELKTILVQSLNKQQKKMIIERRKIEKELAQHDKLLKEKEKLNKQDYLDHKNLLEKYRAILLPQDEELKQKIAAAIENIDAKIARVEEKEEIIQSDITQAAQRKAKGIIKARQTEEQKQAQQKIIKEGLEKTKPVDELLEEIAKLKIQKQKYPELETRINQEIDTAMAQLKAQDTQQRLEQEKRERENREKQEISQRNKLLGQAVERKRLADAQHQVAEKQQQVDQKRAQMWRPWLKRNVTIFARTIQSTITSWWSWLTGRY